MTPDHWDLFAEDVTRFVTGFQAAMQRIPEMFGTRYPYEIGDPVPAHCRVVKPAKGGKTWVAWDYDYWRPVHRVAGVGWVWSA